MDDRFSHVFKDPRFQRVPVKERKLKIDKRFKGMFKDKRFSLKYTVDKRGRPIKSSTSENLQKYYQLSDEDEDSETDEDEDTSSSSEDEKKSKKKEKQLKKNTKKEIEKKAKKSISNGADSKTDAGIVLDAEKSADDSLIENKNTGTGLTKKIIDNTQRKRKLSNTEDALLTSSKKIKKKSKKKIVEEVIDAEEKEEEEEENDDEVDDEEEDEKDEEEEDVSEDEESEDSESGLGSGPDLARGIGNETTSSEDSDSDSESDDETAPAAVEEIVHDWGEFDKDVPLTSDLTRRLAACNMDWDNLTAEDIFVIVNSFKPPEGVLLSIKIFLSDFGKERLEEEISKGPAELAQIAQNDDAFIEDETRANEENSEGNSFHNEKLREYQLKRMKYYYAVIECDTVETANRIYSELDGAEYESSKTCFDLRFIPDDMEFEDEAKDICTQLPSKDLYKPNQFLNTALSEAEVALTWDETDKKRLETTTKNYNKKSEIKLEDFKDYLALSSEEEEDAEKNGSDASLISDSELSDEDGDSNDEGVKSNINKYKKLLEGIEETERKKEDKQLEVTWDIGLKEKTEEALKTKEKKKSASPWNEFLDKVKEKKKKRKAKVKALKKNAESQEPQPTFSDDDIPSDVDFNDPYFKSELISDPNQKSKTQKKKEKKAKRLKKLKGETDSGLTTEEKEQRKQEMAELALLMADEDDINPKVHFDYEKIIKKENKKKSKKNIKAAKEKDDFKLELNDERFSSIYTSSAFNIDRSAPEYKKSAAMEALIEEKLRRRYIEKEFPEKEPKSSKLPVDEPVASRPSTSVDQSVNSLVRSIKTKTKNFNFSKTKPNIKSQIWKKLPKDL